MSERARTLLAVGEVLRSADLLTEIRGSEDVVVLGVSQDSRSASKGDLFLAWKGSGFDAHDFVPAAAERGAVAAVVERPVEAAIPQLVVSDGRRAAALAADAVMGSPSLDLLTIGITGTNGKTTTALLVRHLLTPDHEAAAIGTLGIVGRDGVRPGTEGLTTPGPVQVAVWLRQLLDEGVDAVVLEASSHALEQHRLDGVGFDVAVFTNLTQDHLDYHGDMAAYRAAKVTLVDLVRPDGTIVVNAADPAWADLAVGDRALVTYAVDDVPGLGTTAQRAADIRASRLELGPSGATFDLSVDGTTHRARTPLVGRYNVENLLGAIGAALAAGVPLERVVERLASVPQVSGRLESVVSSPFSVLIDFAHTPAALEGALATIRPLTPGRLIVLFGAGGDRDRTKRRPMAEAVARLADVVVLSSDNPRTEDPDAIIDDLVEGMGAVPFIRQADRREAIRQALEMARPGDTVVLAGKGHETYQVIGTEKRPFDERTVVRRALEAMGAR
jgi:UDP-N-acetylmuramoyl-L-alanyl-D-glutamate--2,6-diaminopimelate ligase